jgi:hypothetical protein
VHALEFVPLHCLHAPAMQTGAPAVGHSALAAEPKSPLQFVQTLPEQTGFVGSLHCEEFTHATQRWLVVLQ